MIKKSQTPSNSNIYSISEHTPHLNTQGYAAKGKPTQKLEKDISDIYQKYPCRKSKYTSFYSSGMKQPIRYLVHLIKKK